MSNITVRIGGVIHNTVTEEKFLSIATELFGEGKTLDEYIKLYNEAPLAKKDCIVVHKEVVNENEMA